MECDSSTTADYLYKNCDGVEFERTSNKLDLRFIPDSIEFKHEARDVATEVILLAPYKTGGKHILCTIFLSYIEKKKFIGLFILPCV